MNECTNCDWAERIKQLQSIKPEEKLYGKAMLKSHEYYNLENINDIYTNKNTIVNINRLYCMFVYNLLELLRNDIFEYKWVEPEELLPASKGKIWDWNSQEEKDEVISSIGKYGVYFPIFTLRKGVLHNQIEELPEYIYKNKYNSYNGNHRIDAIQSIKNYGKVLIIIIPEFCEKSCTGFRYTNIDYIDIDNLPEMVSNHIINNGKTISLYHLTKLEQEMKMHNLITEYKELYPGVDMINCFDYQCAFRILQEFQNVLEVPFTKYYNLHKNLYPFDTNFSIFNDESIFKDALNENKCLYYCKDTLCCYLSNSKYRKCDKAICCKNCPKECRCMLSNKPIL